MKALTIALTLFAATSAFATSMMPSRYEAELNHFDVDAKLLPGMEIVGRATVGTDVNGKEAFLNLYIRLNCGPNQMCPRYMPAPRLIKLPIVRRTADTCGTRVIVARLDRRPVDGGLEELIITDNQGNRCPHFARLASTEVVYRTVSSGMTGKVVKTESKFEGDRLEARFN